MRSMATLAWRGAHSHLVLCCICSTADLVAAFCYALISVLLSFHQTATIPNSNGTLLSGRSSQKMHGRCDTPLCVKCSPAQFAEETKRADRIVPWGIALSLPLNFILGLCYILVILFCLPVSPVKLRHHISGLVLI